MTMLLKVDSTIHTLPRWCSMILRLNNVSTAKFNQYKDKLCCWRSISTGYRFIYETAAEYVKAYTNEGTGETFR